MSMQRTLELFQQIKLVISEFERKRSGPASSDISESQRFIALEIEQARLEDAIYADTNGVEKEEFERCLAFYMDSEESSTLRALVEEYYHSLEELLGN